MTITVQRYTTEKLEEWNDFVKNSKNGHFMFDRHYMDYHADRFCDHSVKVFDKNKLIAVMPANADGKFLHSHQGLTFGGFIVTNKMTQAVMLNCFSHLIDYAKSKGFISIIYKVVPHIFGTSPAEEDLYGLFRQNAKLIRRDASSGINLDHRIAYNSLKKRKIKKASAEGVEFSETSLERFWPLLDLVLNTKHGTKPVHSLDEIQLLQRRFPNNIRCFGGFTDDDLIAGLVYYLNNGVVHAQYIANSEKGRTNGALDFVTDRSIEHFQNEGFRFFNFGISTENAGTFLNEGLIFNKEGFGARTVCFDHYEIKL